MLTKSDVEHIADLAKISLTNDEVEKYQAQLDRILDYMNKLKEVDTQNVPTADGGTIDLTNVWREDEEKLRNKEVACPPLASPSGDGRQEKFGELIDMAPEVEKGQVKVRSVF
ncbi:MAG TPA: Asp-tRNA(Asn)/Glu-tRNA(Gln) amidotransferase subunit GatC [bacterium]|nr:Asp-tRNA(Asn)/Glu-tRNA(Gln) amidotransferase subunit GatC [bacterium]HPL95518.1 Asp-tRNA(Asn)/Glu-tRNA(Gln) amidotransferase subunit GatC [bacterium]